MNILIPTPYQVMKIANNHHICLVRVQLYLVHLDSTPNCSQELGNNKDCEAHMRKKNKDRCPKLCTVFSRGLICSLNKR